MQGRMQQGAGRILRPRVFTQGIEQGRTRILLGEGLLHRRPPARRVFSERLTPASDRPRRRRTLLRTVLSDLGPRRHGFEAGDDHRLNHLEQVVSIRQQETRQQRHRVVAGVTEPALDWHAVARPGR